MMAATLRAYLPWHLRDVAVRALVPMASYLVIGGIPMLALHASQQAKANPDPALLSEGFASIYRAVGPLCCTLGGFMMMSQSVALDRERQHVRFLFATPVAPAAFYLQRFLVALVAFVALFLPVPLTMWALGADVTILGSIVGLVSALVLIGGLTTLAAALTHKDGVVVILIYVLTQTLQQLAAQDVLWEWARPFVRGLPPVHSLSEAMKSVFQGTDWPVTDLIHVNGYGLGLLVAGLLVVRRAPLVR